MPLSAALCPLPSVMFALSYVCIDGLRHCLCGPAQSVYLPRCHSHARVRCVCAVCFVRSHRYDTVQLISFLQQLITYKGYFDSNLEWIGLENVQIVGSMCPTGMVRAPTLPFLLPPSAFHARSCALHLSM
jgi:hypothetical protein